MTTAIHTNTTSDKLKPCLTKSQVSDINKTIVVCHDPTTIRYK